MVVKSCAGEPARPCKPLSQLGFTAAVGSGALFMHGILNDSADKGKQKLPDQAFIVCFRSCGALASSSSWPVWPAGGTLMAGKPVNIGEAEATKNGATGDYERSSIAFPYGDLEDALTVVDAIYANAGTGCAVDQLAAYMRQSSNSGAFRLKLSTARIFGLIETGKEGVSLTQLGRQAADASQRARALSTAFLTVPLYRAVFDKYRGHLLPPPAALQREMASFGVASKQTAKARQAFERSAEQSGFFNHGKERLVEPTFRVGESAPPPPTSTKPQVYFGGGGGTGGGSLHPFILGLLDSLPAPKTPWPQIERSKWLKTAENIFSLIYSDDGPEQSGDPSTE
jgi:hypothetical protein